MTDDTKAQACAAAFKPLAEMGKTLNPAAPVPAKTFVLRREHGYCDANMSEDTEGVEAELLFVRFTDYATLSAQLAAMREVLEEARGHHNTACQHTAGRNCNCDWCKKADAALARAAALGVK